MTDKASITSVHILDKEYRVACPHDNQDALHTAARYLNEKMQEIRSSGKVVGIERIAVMAALNISYELMHSRRQNEDEKMDTQEHIDQLLGKLDQALAAVER
ncbi:cell division protein ZapA [Endozoicomonas elysicola]|uniref:Cell division protein ZapA n=1 Tax=Endozoicomonas elysicola TaxID=305900 RepID=A0A081K7S7_9GAMM|nr:cell division protein ZapA [Endozoicomonas elysicola]KEI70203.1 cell division protein ZapA [Endozoicomonas elysicola]